jgi:hypothetical protein
MKRRSPAAIAAADQRLAGYMERSRRDPGVKVLISARSDPGVACCWCDCVDADRCEGGDCAGCSMEAESVVYEVVAGVKLDEYPLCQRHGPDFYRFWRDGLPGGFVDMANRALSDPT